MHRAVIAVQPTRQGTAERPGGGQRFSCFQHLQPGARGALRSIADPSADKNCRSTRTSSRRARCLPIPSFDAMLAPIFKTIEPEEDELEAARKRVGGPLPETLPVMNWGAYTTHRDPVLSMFAEFAVTNNPKEPERSRARPISRSIRAPEKCSRIDRFEDPQRVLLSDALPPAPRMEKPRHVDRRTCRPGHAGRAGERCRHASQDLSRASSLSGRINRRGAARSTCTISPAWSRCRSTSYSRSRASSSSRASRIGARCGAPSAFTPRENGAARRSAYSRWRCHFSYVCVPTMPRWRRRSGLWRWRRGAPGGVRARVAIRACSVR